MKTYLKIIFIMFFFIFIAMPSISTLKAEYCFQIPDKDTHEDSKRANELVFNMGVKIYESFEEIEKGDNKSANDKIALIKDKTKELECIYYIIEKKLEHNKIDIYKLSERDIGYIHRMIDKRKYRLPESQKELVNLGLKEISRFKEIIGSDNFKFGEVRSQNLETIRNMIGDYYDLTNIGFIISDAAYKSIGK